MRFERASMTPVFAAAAATPAALRRAAGAFAACTRAAISPLTALMLIPICGAIAYSVELGSWQYMQRSTQNAADSAALAAATNDNTSLVGSEPYYRQEARAVAKRFGFTNGVGGTTVTAAPATCPAGTDSGATCYSATITSKFPVLFSGVIGFKGDTTYGSGRGQTITAYAIATTKGGGGTAPAQYCIRTLQDGATVDLNVNGGPKVDLGGCSIVSDAGMNCNGQPLDNAGYAIMGSGLWSAQHYCSSPAAQNLDYTSPNFKGIPDDPYNSSSYLSNIPQNTCPNYKDNLLSGNQTGTIVVCGNLVVGTKVNNGNNNNCSDINGNKCEKLTLTGNDTKVIVYNGTLKLNGNALLTASGATATIILAGTSTLDASNGTLDIKAPGSSSTSPWKGIAVYQTPPSPAPVAATIAGSNSTINVRGIFYLPRTNLTVSGAVNKDVVGTTCFLLVTNTLNINGGGRIIDRSGCADAGVDMPTVTVGGGATPRERLVQ